MRFNRHIAFAAASCVGTVITAIMAAKEGRKAPYISKSLPIYKRFGLFAKSYKFTLLSGALTLGSTVFGCASSIKELGMMSVALGTAVANRDTIIAKARQALPEEARDILDQAINEAATESWRPPVSVEKTGFGNQLCLFAWGGRWFESDIGAVKEQLRYFNEELLEGLPHPAPDEYDEPLRPYANVNDIYAALNISQDQLGHICGFTPDDYDPDEGVIFRFEHLDKYVDYFGETHDVDLFVIYIDERTIPWPGYIEQ